VPNFLRQCSGSSSRVEMRPLQYLESCTHITQWLQSNTTAEWNLQEHSFFMLVSKLHSTDQKRRLWPHSVQKPLTTKLYGRHTQRKKQNIHGLKCITELTLPWTWVFLYTCLILPDIHHTLAYLGIQRKKMCIRRIVHL
jgi:hypothetical protein